MGYYYQIRSYFHKTINLPNQTCPVCKNRGVLKMHFLQQYAWVIGPIMPGGKYFKIDCDFCHKTVPNKLWTKEFNAIYKQEKKTLKTPLKLWSGLFVILFTFLTFFTLYKTRIANPFNFKNVNGNLEINKNNVKNCKVGDVLFVSISKNQETSATLDRFTLAKVLKTEGDKTTIKMYTDKYDFTDQFSLALSDLDHSKFREEIEIKTEKLRKFGNLNYYNPPSKKMEIIPFGYAESVIQE